MLTVFTNLDGYSNISQYWDQSEQISSSQGEAQESNKQSICHCTSGCLLLGTTSKTYRHACCAPQLPKWFQDMDLHCHLPQHHWLQWWVPVTSGQRGPEAPFSWRTSVSSILSWSQVHNKDSPIPHLPITRTVPYPTCPSQGQSHTSFGPQQGQSHTSFARWQKQLISPFDYSRSGTHHLVNLHGPLYCEERYIGQSLHHSHGLHLILSYTEEPHWCSGVFDVPIECFCIWNVFALPDQHVCHSCQGAPDANRSTLAKSCFKEAPCCILETFMRWLWGSEVKVPLLWILVGRTVTKKVIFGQLEIVILPSPGKGFRSSRTLKSFYAFKIKCCHANNTNDTKSIKIISINKYSILLPSPG